MELARGAEPPSSPARPAAGPILLNGNENPYGPSPQAAAAMADSLTAANRYPHPGYEQLVRAIAASHRARPEEVLLAGGSTEIIRMSAAAFLRPGRKLVLAAPTFEPPTIHALAQGAEVVPVPLNHVFAHDLENMLRRIDSSTGLVYICNPNNPTASLTPRADLERLIAQLPPQTHVLIDEAYHHYVGPSGMYTSFLERRLRDPRVIVTRTFSTVYGLAGVRAGYAIADPSLVRCLQAFGTGNEVSRIAARGALAALEDQESVREFVRRNDEQKQEFFNQAMARMLKPIDSQANFVMMNVHRPPAEVVEHFARNNILIAGSFVLLDSYIRVSLGTPAEMRAFWRVWDLLPDMGGAM